MKSVFASLSLAVALVMAAGWSDRVVAEVQIEGCWVRVPPRGATVTAGYCSIKNDTTLPVKVIGVETPKFKSVELHETKMKGGNMEMVKLEAFTIEPGATFVMQPGAAHIMLFDPQSDLRDGHDLPLRFRFDTLPQKVAQAKLAADAPVTSAKQIDSKPTEAEAPKR